jgi:hypothetical protein
MKLNKANLTALNVQCAEIYYNLLAEEYSDDGFGFTTPQFNTVAEWERRLELAVYYGKLALGELPVSPALTSTL